MRHNYGYRPPPKPKAKAPMWLDKKPPEPGRHSLACALRTAAKTTTDLNLVEFLKDAADEIEDEGYDDDYCLECGR